MQIYGVAAGTAVSAAVHRGGLGRMLIVAAGDMMQLFPDVDPRGWRVQLGFLTRHQNDLKSLESLPRFPMLFLGCGPILLSAVQFV